jgi:hypothetical protein
MEVEGSSPGVERAESDDDESMSEDRPIVHSKWFCELVVHEEY